MNLRPQPNALTGKPALLMARGSSACSTENCPTKPQIRLVRSIALLLKKAGLMVECLSLRLAAKIAEGELPVSVPPATAKLERFWSKVYITESPDECWTWAASRDRKGYGRFPVGPRNNQVNTGAHRTAYEMARGPISSRLVIDHLCRNPACVNPSHLEPVTQRENDVRGDGGKWQALKTKCPVGHEYSPGNTYKTPRGHRECRTCRQASR